jgi:hypothetical protein
MKGLSLLQSLHFSTKPKIFWECCELLASERDNARIERVRGIPRDPESWTIKQYIASPIRNPGKGTPKEALSILWRYWSVCTWRSLTLFFVLIFDQKRISINLSQGAAARRTMGYAFTLPAFVIISLSSSCDYEYVSPS